MRSFLPIISVTALLAWNAQADPIQNGGFESAGVASGFEVALTPASTDITSWAVEDGSGLFYVKDGNPLGIAAKDGAHVVSFGRNGGQGGSISQIFDTVPGTAYDVTYWITQTEWDGNDGQTMSVEAFAGATSLAPAVSNNLPVTQNQWSQGAVYTFTATSASTKLTFKDTTTGASGANSSWALDQVEIAQSTNPGNLQLFDPKPSGRVHAAAIQPEDGKIIIAGWFNTLRTGTAQQVTRQRLARLNPDGTVDEAFYPFPDQQVYAVAVLENGQILVGGDFTKLQKGGASSGNPEVFRSHLALLNPDGSVDESFNANLSGGHSVLSVLPLADGRIYIGGNFLTVGVGGPAHARVALLNPDGSPDPDFNYQATAEVTNMAVDSQNRVLIGGYGNVGSGGRVARISSDGVLDSDFNPAPDFYSVYSLNVQPNGKVLIGADFDHVGVNSIANLARFNDNGSWDGTFQPGAGAKVLSVTVLSNHRILATGDFNQFGAPSPATVYGLASIEESGALDTSLKPLTAGGTVFHVLPDRDGRLLVLSNDILQTAQGSRDYIARLQGTPAYDSLSATSGTRVEWLRSGGSAEPAYVVFDLSTDQGVTWTRLGTGTRTTGGWELTGLTLPRNGKLRARARVNSATAYYSCSSLLDRLEDFTVPLTVPGKANLWLSGQPDGIPAEIGDSAPDQSPVLANVTLIPGHDLVFQVLGGTHNGPDPGTTGPDGGDTATHSPENGVGPLTAPLNSLVGVFLAGTPGMAVDPWHVPSQPAPPAYLNFGEPENRNLPLLKPDLLKPFFIGDGLDDESDTQHIRVPAGATHLFLGSFDANTNNLNSGEFTVIVDQVEPLVLPALPESTSFSVIPGTANLPWMFTIEQTSQASGLELRVESTLDPNDPESWTDLPTGSAMQRDGDTWVLSVPNPPVGNRYFRVVAEAPGYESTATVFTLKDPDTQVDVVTPFLIIRQVVDTTPPILNITHTWMEKAGKVTFFKMLLDPQDETGFDPGFPPPGTDPRDHHLYDPIRAIEYRSVLNSTAPIPGDGGWKKWGWQRGVPFSVPFDCKAVVFEIRAVDAAGNKSPIQRRTFKVPFPYGPAPNLEPKFSDIVSLADNGIDCRGLFAARFDDEGQGDDVLQIDRTTGEVRVRRQGNAGAFTDNSFFLTPNSINDSAIGDFDSDGRPDIAIVVDGTLKVFRNDGVDGGGELQFSEMGVGGLAGTGIATVTHCAVGNVTGDGWPDIVITGTGDDGMGGTVTKVAVIINTPDFHLTGANNAVAPAGTDPGLVKLGDVDGDGWLDAVMADPAGNRLLTFRNKQNGGFGGATESDPEFQIKSVTTGLQVFPLSAKALAVGDVTGDGRADAVVVMHWFAATGGDPNDHRDLQMWQLLDARPDGSLRANTAFEVSKGPQGAGPTDFRSDVILSDVNGDRFPELLFTSHFEVPPAPGGQAGGVLVVRLDSRLDPSNALEGFELFETVVPTNAGNPHRLATGRYGNTGRRDIVLANGSNPQLQWIRNRYTTLSKPLEIQGGLFTESDPDGTELPNGVLTYTAYPGEFIDYTVSYANNSPNPLVNATIESLLPPSVELIPVQSDPGHVVVPAKTSRIIRWTETLPPGGAGVKQFRVRILPAARINSVIQPKNTLKGGGKVATSLMPRLTVGVPLVFEFTSVTTGPNPFGLINPPDPPKGDPTGRTTRLNDPIRWRLKLRNKAAIPLNGIKIHVPMPRGVKFDGPVHAIPGMSYVETPSVANDKNPIPTKIDFTIPVLAPFGSTDDLFFIDGTVVEDQGITVPKARNGAAVMVPGFQIKMQVTVELPGVVKRVEPAFVTTVAPTLGIEVYASRNTASPGETIDYTVVARNWSSSDIQDARVVNEIPYGSKLISVKTRDASGGGVHYNDSPLNASSLTPNPSTIAPALITSGWPTLLWDLGTVPGGAHRIMHYTVRIGADVPTEFYPGGNYKEIRIVNGTYNFTGFFSASYTYAILPSNIKTARVSNALPLTQLPKRNGSKAVGTILSAENPQPVPSLWLRKVIVGPRDESLPANNFKYPFLASQEKGKDITYYLVNTKADAADGVMSYHLEFQNNGTSTARNVYVHDVIPDKVLDKARGVTTESVIFQGWVARDGNLVSDFSKFHFYGSYKGIEIPNGREPFTDNNGSGKWEAPESFTDVNGNKVYDGLESIRRVSFYVGDLAPGESGAITYQVQIKGEPKPGTTITSTSGGTADTVDTKVNGLSYIAKPGYHLTADELHFPVNGLPGSVIAEVSDPVKNFLSKIIPRSREELKDDEEVEIGIPYAIGGAAGIRVVGTKMEFDVPVGYEVLGVRLIGEGADGKPKVVRKFVRYPAANEREDKPEWPGDATASPGSISVADVVGLSRVTVLLNDPSTPSPLTDPANPLAKGDIRSSIVFLHCRIDPAKAALLLGTKGESKGYTSDPMRVIPKISGGRPVVSVGGMAGVFEKWLKPFVDGRPQGVPAVALAGGMVILQAGGAGTAVLGPPVAAASSEVLLDVRSDTEKDAKVFVGRSAPMSVTEGQEFTHIIFAGNLTDRILNGSFIKVVVPEGCEAVRASVPHTNFIQLIGNQPPQEASGAIGFESIIPKVDEKSWEKVSPTITEYKWAKPLKAGTGIYWRLGSPQRSDVICVTVTFRALPGSAGSIIRERSCAVLTVNAMDKSPGPIATTVLKGDWDEADKGRVVQGAIEGVGMQYTPKVGEVLGQGFVAQPFSNTIQYGGANLVQLKPNVHGKAASLIALPFDRVFAIGHPDSVQDRHGDKLVRRTLYHSPNLAIVVGPGTKDPVSGIPNGVVLSKPVGLPDGIYPANTVLNKLLAPNFKEFGTVFLAGGGSLVDGGANTIGDAKAGPVKVTPPSVNKGGQSVTTLLSGLAKANLTALAQDGTAPAGGANVAFGTGEVDVAAAASAEVLKRNKAGVVANDGAGVVANDGAGLIGQDAAGLKNVAASLIGQDAAGVAANGGVGVVANDGAGIVAGGGLNASIVAGGGLNAK